MKQMDKKTLKKVHVWVRAVIQLLYFLFIPSAYTAAFNGVKYIFTQIGAGEKVAMTSFVTVLLVICLYTMVFGRFFCGFVCAFGAFGDALHALYIKVCKKRKKKPVKIPEKAVWILGYMKYLVLLLIVLLCYSGVYGKAQGTSPWDVFSMIHAGNFRLGGYGIGLVILLLLMAGMCVQERFFCRFFCPMGAVFSLMPVLPFSVIKRNRENCIPNCKACNLVCPANLEIPSDKEGDNATSGECFSCGKCIGKCPKQNTHNGFLGKLWLPMLVGKAVILFVIFRILY